MAFVHSKKSRLLVGDFHLSAFVKEIGDQRSMKTADTTTLLTPNDAETSIPGLLSGKLMLGGLFDTDATADGQNATLEAEIQAANGSPITFAPEGFALGNRVKSMIARHTEYATAARHTDAVDWKSDWIADGLLDQGVSLADLAAITADGQGANVDNGALTSNGLAAFLHVTAFTGFTSVTFKVQHSVDNSVWVDLATFAAVTGKTAERVVVAGTVNRHLRAFFDVTGAGSVTFQMSGCRR